mmetsp:Transcript_45327/g.97180  ORF Transcript_45327/g.97180 Transcript_45327/m.97180 type:complete len:91 (+) Transcript_45327:236-508(+)
MRLHKPAGSSAWLSTLDMMDERKFAEGMNRQTSKRERRSQQWQEADDRDNRGGWARQLTKLFKPTSEVASQLASQPQSMPARSPPFAGAM